MDRYLKIGSLILFMFSAAISQPLKHFGVKLGPSLASMNWELGGSPDEGIRTRLGLDAGAFVEWLDIPVFSLVSEAHYIQKGMREDIPITTQQHPEGTGESINNDIRLDYLSIALLPKVRLETETIEMYAFAGPRFDFFLSNSISVEVPGVGILQPGPEYQWFVDRFTNPQFGGTAGVGVQLKSLLPVRTGFEFRYSPNFQSALSDNVWNIRNTSYEFLLTVSK